MIDINDKEINMVINDGTRRKLYEDCHIIEINADNLKNYTFINCIIEDLIVFVEISNCSFINCKIKHATIDFDNLYIDRKSRDGLKRSRMFQVPSGNIIGYKKIYRNIYTNRLSNPSGLVCKLLIPADAARSNAFSKKCRASKAFVLEGEGYSWFVDFFYKKHEWIYPDSFDRHWYHECAPGIHFFMTKEEAERYRG